MKKISWITLALTAAIFSACNNGSPRSATGKTDSSVLSAGAGTAEKLKEVLDAQAFSGAITQIPTGLAKDMINFYRFQRVQQIMDSTVVQHHMARSGDGKAHDTECMWLSNDDLKTLVALSASVKGDGVRAYFAVYPVLDKTETPGGVSPTDLRNRLTLVFVPTMLNSDSSHGDMVDTTGGGTFLPDLTFALKGVDNHGGICPPPVTPCPGTTLGAVSYSAAYHPTHTY